MSLVSFRHFRWANLYPILIYIVFLQSVIPYRFFSGFRRAGVLSLEVKYDMFKMEMKGFGRGSRINTRNIASLIRTYQVSHRRLVVGGSLHGGGV